MVYWFLVTAKKALSVTVLLAAALYVTLWVGIADHWSWLDSADTWTLQRFHDHGVMHPAWVTFWRLVSDVFSPNALRIVGVVWIVVALVRRQPRVALFLAVAGLPAGLVTAAAKALSDRPRPETALTHAASTSFPSGHALGIMVGVLTFGTLLWPRIRASMRVPAVALGAALVFLVGLSRVVLNVHHPSDVVAGWALGLVYYVVCVGLVPPSWTVWCHDPPQVQGGSTP